MTDSEFQSAIANLSPKIKDLMGKPNGAAISAELGSLAKSLTSTSDLQPALDALKADAAKLSAMEALVAARIAALPATVAAKPIRGLMWVAPTVSFLVIVGFFCMLGALVYEEYHSRAGATTVITTEKPTTPEKTAPADKATPTEKTAPADKATPAEKTTPAGKPAPAGKNAAESSTTTTEKSTTPSPNSLQNVLFTLLGALGAAFTQVVNFWLGSSKGSSDKTALLAAANPVPGHQV